MTEPENPTLRVSPGPPTIATGPYPPPPPVSPVRRPRRRIAIIAGLAAVVVTAIVTTVVLLVGGPSVDDVAGTWSQKQSLVGMGFDQTLVVSGDRFTYTLAVTTGADNTSVPSAGGLLDGLLGGGLSTGVRCTGKVEVDGDRFVFASRSGPCGTIYGTLDGDVLTLHGGGQRPSEVDLVRE